MYDLPVYGQTAKMEATELGAEVATSGDLHSATWSMAAHYHQLLQHQRRQGQADEEGVSSDPGSATSRDTSPRERPNGEGHEVNEDSSSAQDVLEKLKQQVANVAHENVNAKDNSSEPADYRLHDGLHVPAPTEPVHHRHTLSPHPLLAASMANNPPSLVPLPGLGLAGYVGSGGRCSTSPPPREPASPPASSASHSPRQGSGHAAWNFEEQFKQLYEIDDNPKRKEFLDDLFRFMHNRGTPINRLPIMAKQVLDMYELYNLVVARGGLVEVINKKLWQEIIKGLKLPSSITSAAFTLRTQYMKYLYPIECDKEGLSSPADLQAAIDGNRREGRRGGYGSASYADLMHRTPLITSSMAQTFGLPNGMPVSLHQPGLSPLSLVTSRPGVNGAGHPMPPSSPFLPGMGGPMMPSANDTLMTLWSLYNRQTAPSPPHRKPEGITMAPQSEALNLGVHREMPRPEEDRERHEEADRESAQERERPAARERDRERLTSIKRECPEENSPQSNKTRPPAEDDRSDAFPTPN